MALFSLRTSYTQAATSVLICTKRSRKPIQGLKPPGMIVMENRDNAVDVIGRFDKKEAERMSMLATTAMQNAKRAQKEQQRELINIYERSKARMLNKISPTGVSTCSHSRNTPRTATGGSSNTMGRRIGNGGGR